MFGPEMDLKESVAAAVLLGGGGRDERVRVAFNTSPPAVDTGAAKPSPVVMRWKPGSPKEVPYVTSMPTTALPGIVATKLQGTREGDHNVL